VHRPTVNHRRAHHDAVHHASLNVPVPSRHHPSVAVVVVAASPRRRVLRRSKRAAVAVVRAVTVRAGAVAMAVDVAVAGAAVAPIHADAVTPRRPRLAAIRSLGIAVQAGIWKSSKVCNRVFAMGQEGAGSRFATGRFQAMGQTGSMSQTCTAPTSEMASASCRSIASSIARAVITREFAASSFFNSDSRNS
jgi:hypothetical protein